MAEKVATLVQRGLLSTVPSDRDAGDLMVAITDQGREAHARAIDEIRPDVEQLLEGISMDDVRTTLKVVQDIRRTLDHMPGR
jgi:DNA-binding MarR family transcriptional regulator